MISKKVKKEWVKALRSGEYKQGRGALCKETGGQYLFCALGVLADIAVDGYWVRAAKNRWSLLLGDTRYTGGLPKKVIPGALNAAVTSINDVDYLTFSQIADWIETNVKAR